MLTGQRPTTPVSQRIVEALLLALHAYPFLLMGGAMTFVGLLAIGPRKDIPELWICLPAGLALLSVFAGQAYWQWWHLPRKTVTRFVFDGSQLFIESPAQGCFAKSIQDLGSVQESRGRRKLLGWWLRFRDDGAVFLHAEMPNARELVQSLYPLTIEN